VTPPRVLVTGARGVLGRAVERVAGDGRAQLVKTSRRPDEQYLALELTRPETIGAVLDTAAADAVLHLAAASAPGWCEEHPAEATATNRDGSAALAAGCRERGIRLVAMSTDLVFPGRPGGAYREHDEPAPLSAYARTKVAAETAILAAHPEALVVRTSLILAAGLGHVAAFERAVRSGVAPLFTDERRSPIAAVDLAAALLELATTQTAGLLHLGGPVGLSRLQLGQLLADGLGLARDALRPIRSDELEPPARPPRPGDVTLESGRAYALLGRKIRSIEDALDDLRPA